MVVGMAPTTSTTLVLVVRIVAGKFSRASEPAIITGVLLQLPLALALVART